MEKWDAYTHNEMRLDFDLIRDEIVPEGVYHIVCEVLVRHHDGTFLLMQRAWEKKGYPGYFEATAGGSVLKDETPLQAIKRELYEETGIQTEDIKEIGKTIDHPCIFYSYIAITDCDKQTITLQEGETIAYKWVSHDEFIRFWKSPQSISSQYNRLKHYIKNTMEIHMITITQFNQNTQAQLADGFFQGWPNPPTKETHLKILKNSTVAYVAIDESTQTIVGFVNALSDGVLSSMIPLLEVIPDYQGLGLGTRLMETMITHLKDLYMIDVCCDEGILPFYQKLGFMTCKGAIIRNWANQKGNNSKSHL